MHEVGLTSNTGRFWSEGSHDMAHHLCYRPTLEDPEREREGPKTHLPIWGPMCWKKRGSEASCFSKNGHWLGVNRCRRVTIPYYCFYWKRTPCVVMYTFIWKMESCLIAFHVLKWDGRFFTRKRIGEQIQMGSGNVTNARDLNGPVLPSLLIRGRQARLSFIQR